MKDIKIFLKKKKKKSDNMFVNVTKISQKKKTKTFLSIGKKYESYFESYFLKYKKIPFPKI